MHEHERKMRQSLHANNIVSLFVLRRVSTGVSGLGNPIDDGYTAICARHQWHRTDSQAKSQFPIRKYHGSFATLLNGHQFHWYVLPPRHKNRYRYLRANDAQ